MYAHIDWVNEPPASTTKVPIRQIGIEGGLSELTDYLVERNLVPQWWADGKTEPPSK